MTENKNEIKKEITKEGVRLTHPTGVIQILTPKRLEFLINQFEKAKAETDTNLKNIRKDLKSIEAAASQSP